MSACIQASRVAVHPPSRRGRPGFRCFLQESSVLSGSFALLLALLLPALLNTDAHALSCGPPRPLLVKLARCDAMFVGTVEAYRSERREHVTLSGCEVRIEEMWKGVDDAEFVEVFYRGKAVEKGESYLFFCSRRDGKYYSGPCGGYSKLGDVGRQSLETGLAWLRDLGVGSEPLAVDHAVLAHILKEMGTTLEVREGLQYLRWIDKPFGPALHYLQRLAKDADQEIRELAVKTVAALEFEGGGSTGIVLRAAGDESAVVRRAAVESLDSVRLESHVRNRAVLAAQTDVDPGVRIASAGLRKLAEDPEVYSGLLRLSRDPDLHVQKAAFHALQRKENQRPEAVDRLIEALADSVDVVRAWAVESLGTFGSEAGPGLDAVVRGLGDPSLQVRRQAAATGWRLADHPRSQILEDALCSPVKVESDEMARAKAATSIGFFLPSPQAFETLRGLLRMEDDSAEAALLGLLSLERDDLEVLADLDLAILSPNEKVRRTAVVRAGDYAQKGWDVDSILDVAVADSSRSVTAAAGRVLRKTREWETENGYD